MNELLIEEKVARRGKFPYGDDAAEINSAIVASEEGVRRNGMAREIVQQVVAQFFAGHATSCWAD